MSSSTSVPRKIGAAWDYTNVPLSSEALRVARAALRVSNTPIELWVSLAPCEKIRRLMATWEPSTDPEADRTAAECASNVGMVAALIDRYATILEEQAEAAARAGVWPTLRIGRR